jgi:hypothetical protein
MCYDATPQIIVLSAIAQGKRELAEISTTTLLDKDRAVAVVATLIDLRLIEKRIRASVPIDQHDTARYARYFLSDPFLRFYYRLVNPNRSSSLSRSMSPFCATSRSSCVRSWRPHLKNCAIPVAHGPRWTTAVRPQVCGRRLAG